MAVLGGVRFRMREVPRYQGDGDSLWDFDSVRTGGDLFDNVAAQIFAACLLPPEVHSRAQGYLAQKKTPTRLDTPKDPRPRPYVGSSGGAFSYERKTPVRHGNSVASCGVGWLGSLNRERFVRFKMRLTRREDA